MGVLNGILMLGCSEENKIGVGRRTFELRQNKRHFTFPLLRILSTFLFAQSPFFHLRFHFPVRLPKRTLYTAKRSDGHKEKRIRRVRNLNLNEHYKKPKPIKELLNYYCNHFQQNRRSRSNLVRRVQKLHLGWVLGYPGGVTGGAKQGRTMEESEIPRLSKRFSDTNKDKISSSGEVDYKNKAGTAWSHNFLNQKPWHPLSYPNQRRKWIAEQTHAQRDRRAEEVAREFSQEQEFFRQTALASKKEKEKMETIKAVSFMYVRPPGYNAESAKAAEISDEKKKLNPSSTTESTSAPLAIPENKQDDVETKKKSRPKDVFGRALPTEEEFDVLKNAPRFETGAPARAKPFAVEIRNVKCVRCGTYGHQSGDRECTLKNAIMPNDENRLKRDDPLTTITAQADFAEPLKWELKQRPGMSPPRGGFTPDDPNQQIVAEDIFDEYGGFLGGDGIPSLLLNPFKEKKAKKHSGKKNKHKRHSSTKDKVHHMIDSSMSQGVNVDLEMKVSTSSRKHKEIHHHKRRRRPPSDSSSSDEMRMSTLIKHKEKYHHSRRWATSSNSESDHEMIISSDKKHERIHGSKRVNRLSPSLNSEMRKTLSKRHRDKYHYRRAWLPSVFDSDGERRMSSDKKPRKYHDSGRWSPSSAFDSDSERRTSLSKKDEERNHHRQSPYSNSDSAHEMRTRMSTKHEHHDKRRISSSRKHRKERHHGRRN